jgi:hypothetical protein
VSATQALAALRRSRTCAGSLAEVTARAPCQALLFHLAEARAPAVLGGAQAPPPRMPDSASNGWWCC